MAKLSTIKNIMNEATDIASLPGGSLDGKNIQLTQFSAGEGKGQGIQITSGPKNFVKLDRKGAENVGKLLIKWARTQ